MGEVLLHAAPEGLEIGARGLDPLEDRLVHVGFAGHVAERPFGDGRQAALGRHVGVQRELQARVGGIAGLLLQDAEHGLGHVGAGRADGHDGIVLRGDVAQGVDALLGSAAVVQVLDDQARLAAVAHGHAAGLVDLGRSCLHGRLALLAKDAHHAALGAEAIDLDGALLGQGRRGRQHSGGRSSDRYGPHQG